MKLSIVLLALAILSPAYGSNLYFSGVIYGEGSGLLDYGTNPKEIDISFELKRASTVKIDVSGGTSNGGCRGFSHEGLASTRSFSLFDPELSLVDSSGQIVARFDSRCGIRASNYNEEHDFESNLEAGKYKLIIEGQDVGRGWDSSYTVNASVSISIKLY
jgi:hypothetical protein